MPADAFHSNDAARIPKILELVKDVGCNAMRVWGGGVYESDEFYDLSLIHISAGTARRTDRDFESLLDSKSS